MNGILRLNHCDVGKNPAFGSHDPSMMWDPVTKKYYSYSTDVYMPQCGLNDKIGIPVRSSADLINFEYKGTVLSKKAVKEGSNNGSYPDTKNFWAPYAEYVHGEYRMYYSATKTFGSSESKIWLAVAKNPLGPFENRGVVMDTWGTDDTFPNAIDAHIIWENSHCWLIYGSFFGGIYMKELNGETGLPLDGNPKTLGHCISRKSRQSSIDGPEGASVIYAEETGYYYLFQSYGWLGDTYDIRVGRSRRAEGPYFDMEGKNLAEESLGVKIANSYLFSAASSALQRAENGWEWGGFRGPGHGVPFRDPVSGNYFFVHHIRDGASICKTYDKKENRNSYAMHYMMIRPMLFLNGWPVLSPEPYAGENFEPVSPEKVEGCWEILVLDDKDNNIKVSKQYKLSADSMYLQNARIFHCYDFENGKIATAASGFDNSGVAYWGKFVYSIV